MFSIGSPQNVSGVAVDKTNVYDAIRWIQLVLALLSILGSGYIMLYLAIHRLANSPELQPLFLLTGSNLLLALCWLIGASLFSREGHTHCSYLHTVEQIFYMASFFYMLNYVWSLYTGVKSRFYCGLNGFPTQASLSASMITAVVSGLLPLLLMSPVLIVGGLEGCYANYSQSYRCLLMHTGALYLTSDLQERGHCFLLHKYSVMVFLASCVVTLLGIVVLMGKARRIHRRVVTSGGYLGDRQWASMRVVDRQLVLYPSVFLLCWAPALCVAAVRLLNPSAVQGTSGVIWYIAQALTSSSQGLLNSLLYGCSPRLPPSRLAGRRLLSRDADTQTPLLSSQRRGYHTLRPFP